MGFALGFRFFFWCFLHSRIPVFQEGQRADAGAVRLGRRRVGVFARKRPAADAFSDLIARELLAARQGLVHVRAGGHKDRIRNCGELHI